MTIPSLDFDPEEKVYSAWPHIELSHAAKLASNLHPELRFGEFLRQGAFAAAAENQRLQIDRYGRITAGGSDLRESRPAGRFIERVAGRAPAWHPAGNEELHPNLVRKAVRNLKILATSGQLLTVMARGARFENHRLSETLQAIERALSAGQCSMYFDYAGACNGLLFWARPSASALAQLHEGGDEPIHCSELSAGGDLLLLEFCAGTADCADELLRDVEGLLDSQDRGYHLSLQPRGGARREPVFIAREDMAVAGAWLKQKLLADRVHAIAGIERQTAEA